VRPLALLLVVAAACNDVRGFEGTWNGPRVGDAAPLHVGVATNSTATLAIDAIDLHGLRGRLSIDGLVVDSALTSLDGAEADVLSGITFDGSPSRVYLAFAAMPDGGGDAFAVIALFDDKRVEVRVMRGGSVPLYAIYSLARGDAS